MSKKYTKSDFVAKAIAVHGNRYDYSCTEYTNSISKVTIICPKHGAFEQLASSHLRGQGCPKCFDERRWKNRRLPFDTLIEAAKRVHGNKYDYSRVVSANTKTKVEIICPYHGVFSQAMNSHIYNGQGCPKCFAEATRKRKTRTQEEFLRLAKEAHGDTYDYSKAVYVSGHSKICIICRKHGEFWQEAECHISGQGCPACLESAGEQLIRNTLLENGVMFESQKRYTDWLGKQSLDFFLPDFNIGIEHQGKQHYTPVKHWGNFNVIHSKDLRKQRLCAEHGITILYLCTSDVCKFPKENWEWMQPNLFTDIKDILRYIQHLQ